MPIRDIHTCECALCQQEADHPQRPLHAQMNLFFSRLDEQQRRWYAAVEAQRVGHGGLALLAQITGLDEDTIVRGRRELHDDLAQRPTAQVRVPGGGRPCVEKKTRR